MSFDPVSAIANSVTTIIDKIFPDADAKLKAQLQQATLEINIQAANALAQIDLNKTEASHPSIFVAGWRPFCGWICGVGLAYSFLLQPFLQWVSTIAAIAVPPKLDTSTLTTVLMAMLGMASIRSYDKSKGADTKDTK